MVDFILVLGEPPETSPEHQAAVALIASLREHILALPDHPTQALAAALLDLGVASANCLARSAPGTLDTSRVWDGMPAPQFHHVEAAVVRLCAAHQAGHAGALACLEDMAVFIRDLALVE